jgi:hypothetical protein
LVEYNGGVHWWSTLVEYITYMLPSHHILYPLSFSLWFGGRQQRLPPLRLKNPAGKVKLSPTVAWSSRSRLIKAWGIKWEMDGACVI